MADMNKLAGEIKKEHGLVPAAERTALQHAKKAGDLLIRAKADLPATLKWEPWVEAECGVDRRSASTYMRIAANWEAVKEKGAHEGSIRAALKALKPAASNRPKPKRVLTLDDVTSLMERHHVSGSTDDFLTLLAELGVKLKKEKKATTAA